MSLIVKIKLLELASSLSLLFPNKTQWFVHLSFNLTLHLINSILSDPKKLIKYFNGVEIAMFLKISFVSSLSVVSNNLALHLKDFESLVSAILLIKWVASPLE